MAGKDPAIYFGVGDPRAECSSIWRLWAHGPQGDVYVACRPVADLAKVSLHASGDFRDAWTERGLQRYGLSGRLRLRWQRKAPVDGWIYAYRVKIPGSELRRLGGIPRPERIPSGVYWHPKPSDGWTVEFTVLIGPVGVARGGFPGAEVGAAFAMGLTTDSGDTVALMVRETEGNQKSESELAEMKARAVGVLRSEGRSGWTNQRAAWSVVDRQGVGTAIEVALPDDAR